MDKKGFGFFKNMVKVTDFYVDNFSGTLDRESFREQMNQVVQKVQGLWNQITHPRKNNPNLTSNAADTLKDLTTRIQRQQNVLFMPIPSSSGQNALPKALAECLTEYFREKGVNTSRIPDTDRHIFSATAQSIKAVPEVLRWGIADKQYVTNPEHFQAFKRKAFLKDGTPKAVYIIDDSMRSGASLSAFIRALEVNGIPVSGAIALSGCDIFGHTKEIQDRLDILLQKNNIEDICAAEMMAVSVPAELKTFCDFLARSPQSQKETLQETAKKLRKSATLNKTLKENSERLEALESTPALIHYQINRRQSQL